jgi:hypothetical protein
LLALLEDDVGKEGLEDLEDLFELMVADFIGVFEHLEEKFYLEEGLFLGVFVVFDQGLEAVRGGESLREVAGELIVDFGHVVFLLSVGGEKLLAECELFGEEEVDDLELFDREEGHNFGLVKVVVVGFCFEEDFVEKGFGEEEFRFARGFDFGEEVIFFLFVKNNPITWDCSHPGEFCQPTAPN